MAEIQNVAEIQDLAKIQDLIEIQDLAYKLAKILDRYGVKYDQASVKWAITSDDAQLTNAINQIIPGSILSKTHVIFLEEGNGRAGLEHIYQRHRNDFNAKAGVNTRQGISDYIANVMQQGKYIQHTVTPNRGGIKVVYTIGSNAYLHMSIANNGFVVTAYMSSNP